MRIITRGHTAEEEELPSNHLVHLYKLFMCKLRGWCLLPMLPIMDSVYGSVLRGFSDGVWGKTKVGFLW